MMDFGASRRLKTFRIKGTVNLPQKISENEKVKKLLSDKELEKTKVENNLNRLYSDYKNELISLEQYLLIREKYEPELKSLEQIIYNLQNTLEQEKEMVDGLNAFIEKFINYINIGKITRVLLISLIDEICIHSNGEIEIRFVDQDFINHAIDYVNTI